MEINGKSTVSELIGLLMSSFQTKEFKLVEEVLSKREDNLRAQLEKEQQQRCSFERKHGDAVRTIFEMQVDFKKLKNENLELQEELKMLRMEKVETANKLLKYEERVANLEKAVANEFPADVSKIQKLACDSSENVLQKRGNRNLDCEQTLENTSNPHSNAQASYGAPSPSNGPCCETTTSHVEKKGCDDGTLKKRMENLLDGHSNVQNCLEGVQDAPRVCIDSVKQEKGDDSLCAAAALKSISPIVIEIIESDDEDHTCCSVLNSNKKYVTFTESGINACPTEDENERAVTGGPLENFSLKRKRDLTNDSGVPPLFKKRTEQCQGLQRKLDFLSSDDSSDYSSSDSDDDCSEYLIKKMIQSLQEDCKKSQKTWNAETDMRREFLSNDELCMNAVCALYRKLFRKEKLINSTSIPIDLKIFNEMSGKDIAEYLIDGDPQYKLKRTVSEVQEKDSTVLDRCRMLAIKYYKTLFEIYRKNEDPFFIPSS